MADKMAVKNQKTYLIVPFGFQEPLTQTLEKVNKEHFSGDAEEKHTHHFFDHIEGLVRSGAGDGDGSIGRKFMLSQDSDIRKLHKLPPNKNNGCQLYIKEQLLATLSVESIGLYLFETQVGFITMEFCYKGKPDLEQVIQANYYLKRLQIADLRLQYRNGPSEEDLKTFTLLDVLLPITTPLGIKTYFEGQREEPVQALLFTTTMLAGTAQDRTELDKALFRARRVFKASYLPSRQELQTEGNPEVIPLFENSHWGISLEGLANIVETVGVEQGGQTQVTNAFFDGNYSSNLERTYLYLYLLALHQRYGLLLLSIEAAELSRSFDELTGQPSAQTKKATSLHLKLVRFKLRSTFTQVSNVTHQDKLYSSIRGVLKIEELLEELHFEMESLSTFMQLAEKDQTDRFQKGIALVSFLFLPFGAVTAFYGMNFGVADGAPFWYFWIASGLAYGGAFILYYLWSRPRKSN